MNARLPPRSVPSSDLLKTIQGRLRAWIRPIPPKMWKRVPPAVALGLFASTIGANALNNLGRWKDVVEKVSHRQGLFLKFGDGWCLDPDCELVVTNYHVVKLVGTGLRIRGVGVRQYHLATGETDEGARWIKAVAGLHLRYNPVRDIAILRVQSPL